MPACRATLLVGGGLGPLSTSRRSVTIDPQQLARRVQEHVAVRFPASTHIQARGFWKGQGEPSVVVDLVTPAPAAGCGNFHAQAQCTAGAIARDLEQEAVGVVAVDERGTSRVDFVDQSHSGKACRIDRSAASEARAAIRRLRAA